MNCKCDRKAEPLDPPEGEGEKRIRLGKLFRDHRTSGTNFSRTIFTQLFKHAHQAVPSSALILWLKASPCNVVIKQA